MQYLLQNTALILMRLHRQITSLIDYPGIMQAINFEDSSAMAASGQTDLSTAEARISAWQASVSSFGDAVHSVEQDKIVVAQ